jgi:hypothetical protein
MVTQMHHQVQKEEQALGMLTGGEAPASYAMLR